MVLEVSDTETLPDGSAASQLDCFLISEDLISMLKVSAQWVGNRDISDHCPVTLKCGICDWGPKPFRFNNCWLEHRDFKGFVVGCWRDFGVNGLKLYVLKEKLKLLKDRLKTWNSEAFGFLDLRIVKIVEDMNLINNTVCVGSLIDEEQRRALTTNFWQQLRYKESFLAQKSRARWVQEGD